MAGALQSAGNVAGQGAGTVLNIADLLMAARQGRLAPNLLARAEALQNPASRDAIAASPLLSGFMGTYGGRQAVDAAPGGPSLPERQFRGNLPPLGPSAQLQQDLTRGKIRHLQRFGEAMDRRLGGRPGGAGESSGDDFVETGMSVTPTGGAITYGPRKVQRFKHGTDPSQIPSSVQPVFDPHPLGTDQSRTALGYRLFGQSFNPANPAPSEVAAIDAALREQSLGEKSSIASRNQRAQIRAARANLKLISQPSDDLGGRSPLDFLPNRFEALTGSYGGVGQRLRQLGILSQDPAAQKAITRMNAQIGSAVTFIKAFGDTANAAVAEREATIGSLLVDPNRDTPEIAQEKVAFVEQVLSQLDAQLAARGGQLSPDDVAAIVRQVSEGGLTQTTTPRSTPTPALSTPPATVNGRRLRGRGGSPTSDVEAELLNDYLRPRP